MTAAEVGSGLGPGRGDRSHGDAARAGATVELRRVPAGVLLAPDQERAAVVVAAAGGERAIAGAHTPALTPELNTERASC